MLSGHLSIIGTNKHYSQTTTINPIISSDNPATMTAFARYHSPAAIIVEREGTKTRPQTLCERCGATLIIYLPTLNLGFEPIKHSGDELKKHECEQPQDLQPTTGNLLRRRTAKTVSLQSSPARKHIPLHIELKARFLWFLRATGPRIVPFRPSALRERRGVTFYISFSTPNHKGGPNGHKHNAPVVTRPSYD